MSKALVCDQCGESVPLTRRGESENGEEAAWLRVETTWTTADLCTRECAHAFLDDEDFIAVHNAEAAAVMEIARSVSEGGETQ